MAIRKPDEIMNSLNAILGDNHSDAALALIEDVNDTLAAGNSNQDGVDWQQRYNENDAAWRQRYRDRFFGKGDDNDNDNNDNNPNNDKPNKPRTYADLFKK